MKKRLFLLAFTLLVIILAILFVRQYLEPRSYEQTYSLCTLDGRTSEIKLKLRFQNQLFQFMDCFDKTVWIIQLDVKEERIQLLYSDNDTKEQYEYFGPANTVDEAHWVQSKLNEQQD